MTISVIKSLLRDVEEGLKEMCYIK